MSVKFQSRLPQIEKQLRSALGLTVKQQAQLYFDRLQAALLLGMKSSLGNQGNFVTGRMAAEAIQLIQVSENEWVIGTNDIPLISWELGHVNLFTRNWERYNIMEITVHEVLMELQQIAQTNIRNIR